MNRVRLFALAVTVALHVFVLWSMLHARPEGAVQPASTPRKPEPVNPRKAADPESPRSTDALVRARQVGARQQTADRPQPARAVGDQAWRQAYEAGRAFEHVRKGWMRRFVREQHGDDIAALLDLPTAETWHQLETLALDGDKDAARALIDLGGICLPRRDAGVSSGLLDSLTRGTDALDAAFLQGAYEAEVETEQQACSAGAGIPRLRALVERKLGAAAAEALRGKGPQDWSVVWDAFRHAFDIGDTPEPTDPMDRLARRLERPGGPASQSDVDALLAGIEDDPRAVNQLSWCFIIGCNGIDALPAEERLSWSLRAARTGYYPAVHDVIQQTRHSDPVTAYQWAAFERALWLEGCGPLINAGQLAMIMQTQYEIASAMTPVERALGERRAQDLLARYRAGAMAVQGCAPKH